MACCGTIPEVYGQSRPFLVVLGNASKEYGTNMCDLLTVLGDYDHGLEEIGVKSMERSLKKFRLT